MSKPRASEKPQGCNYCSEPATQSFLWAEGHAYIPTCGAHEGRARAHIQREDGEGPAAVHTIEKSGTREPGSVDCWVCGATGMDDAAGMECEFCDGSRYLTPGEQKAARCPCGDKVTRTADGGDWLTHMDGSTSHDKGDVPPDEDGHYPDVSEAMRRTGAKIDMGRYFKGGVGDWSEIPDLFTKKYVHMNDRFWGKQPVEQVPLDSLHSTQGRVWQKHLDSNARGEGGSEDHPRVINHQGKNWVFDGHHRAVNAIDAGETHMQARVYRTGITAESYRPTRRIFGPTYGLDIRLFDGEHLKPAVRSDLMAKWHRFCAELDLREPDVWSIVYFSGSEASEWTSPDLKGNNDFDILIGIDNAAFFRMHPPHTLGVETGQGDELAHELTSRMRETLVDPHYLLPGGDPDDPWDQTWYVNPNSYRIADIRPYAAYDVTHDIWAVRPPHIPDWNLASFPEGPALAEMGDAYDDLVKAILKLPEPYRTQQGNALWEHLHGDRSRAFGPNGEGWYDPANVIEKWLDQEGTWKDLWELHHRAEEDPSTLLAPANWSNDPGAVSRN